MHHPSRRKKASGSKQTAAILSLHSCSSIIMQRYQREAIINNE